jgi:SOS response regulatory protein OraA/RecX
MNDYFNLTTLSALLGLLGLAFDIWGVWKLFSVEPIQIKQVDKAIFGATLEEWKKEEKTEYLINQLNQQISQVNYENKKRTKKALLYRRFLIIGFSLQFISIILQYISTLK